MRDADSMGVLHKGGRDRFQLPEAQGLIQGNDVDPVLEAVGLFLLRLFAPIKDASRKEKPVLDAPDRADLLNDRDDILLGDRHDRPGLVNGIRELRFRDPGLGQAVGDDLLRRSIQKSVGDGGFLQQQHLVLQDDLVLEAAAVVTARGDIALKNRVQHAIIAQQYLPRLLVADADICLELWCKAYLCPIKIAGLVGVDLYLDSLIQHIAAQDGADLRVK